ncbi:beta-ketoacyl-ACP synthase [Andreprevotia chitinilytica]|uniref:beta-ketoacyl-ACP synthase n=1 Tax=Andreprevotia chitinilytica TaxID=396808 RepID=UPI000550FA42|nr:beta-ketoacyl-ACP synthase [Andreprevotia chitinilytica]
MTASRPPVYLNALGLLCALGNDVATVRHNLFSGSSPGMQQTDAYSPGRTLTLGLIDAALPSVAHLPIGLRSRNNAVLLAALAQIRPELDRLCAGVPPERIAIVLGTSTSGIAEGEAAIAAHTTTGQFPPAFDYAQQELGGPAALLQYELGTRGPAYCVSTACTSSAKALASGARLLQAGLADVVLAGGVDTLARFTIAGFSSLEAVDAARCRPFSATRCGINIGEGAALFVMSREPDDGAVQLAGWGETSDAHHISAPDPTGAGAIAAITQALARANLSATDIGYVNLHGTATPQNDAMEALTVTGMLPGVPASSTKSLTGHTLGAAGAIEAAFCWLALTDAEHRLPPHVWDGVADPALPALPLVNVGQTGEIRAALSNSFAFGGNNIALVLTR